MRSINTKITIIIIIGLLFQVLLTGTFYQLTLTKRIIYEINMNGNTRQVMLNSVIKNIEKIGNNVPKIQTFLLSYSQRNNVDFKIKNMNGNIIYMTSFADNMSRKIEERAFAEFRDKPTYAIYAYFPTKVDSILASVKGNDTKLILGLIVFMIALIMSFTIYWIIGIPLKKLRRAMGNIRYGNTEVSIPYQAKDEVGLLCRNLEDMGSRLKKSEDNQNHLIQAISHDLKTPLTSILGYVTRLSDGKVNSEERRKDYYDIIKRKSYDLKYLIDELEDFSNLSKNEKYKMQKVNLNQFTSELCSEMLYESKQRGKGFTFTNKVNGEFSILIDEGKMRRVFTNIVGNSYKYAGDDAVISITCSTIDNKAVFEISDDGIGVPENELDKIFNRFYRIETSRSREMGGTGLGLAICRDIIKSHGGDIYGKSNVDGGLCIKFTIPIMPKV